MQGIEKIVLVHRLREVIAQIGFTRFEAAVTDIQGELDMDVQPAPLARDSNWVPAVENRGEGIFIKFSADAVASWMNRNEVLERGLELAEGYSNWKSDHEQSKR
jgi:hypothetical protein